MFTDKDFKFTRGDTFSFEFVIENEDGDIIFDEPNDIYLTFKKSWCMKPYIFQKRLSNNTISYDNVSGIYNVTFLPKDTQTLSYGKYVYDIEIVRGDTIYTGAKGTIKLLKEATYASNEV